MSVDLDSDDQDLEAAMTASRRQISPKSSQEIRRLHAAEILTAFGMEPEHAGHPRTPDALSGPSSISPPATTAIRSCSRSLRPNVGAGRIAA